MTAMLATQTMSTAQAAAYLQVSPRTVQRLVISGELEPLAKLPGRTGSYVFNASVVVQFGTAEAERRKAAKRKRQEAARKASLWLAA